MIEIKSDRVWSVRHGDLNRNINRNIPRMETDRIF